MSNIDDYSIDFYGIDGTKGVYAKSVSKKSSCIMSILIGVSLTVKSLLSYIDLSPLQGVITILNVPINNTVLVGIAAINLTASTCIISSQSVSAEIT